MFNEEHFYDWCNDNSSWLETEFIEKMPAEDVPLDDDLSDFFDNSDEFYEFKKKEFENREDN